MTFSSTNLATERACVFSVLSNLHLLDGLPQTGTISGTVLSDNADLLGSFGLKQITLVVRISSEHFHRGPKLTQANGHTQHHWDNFTSREHSVALYTQISSNKPAS